MANELRVQYGFFQKLRVWFGSRSVIVLTMGKVGTLTICNSLEQIGFRHAHPHSLYYTRPGVHFLDIRLTLWQRIWYTYKTVTKRLKVFIWSALSSEIMIITGVRDPFSRAISAYFEQSHYFGGVPDDWSFSEIKEDFEKRACITATTTWFDKEIRRFSGIDVLNSDFPRDKGYKSYQKGSVSLFVYKMDSLNNLGPQIAEFLSVQDFSILPTNETGSSHNALKYKEFARRYKFDREIANELIESDYMKTFFSTEDIATLLKRWVA